MTQEMMFSISEDFYNVMDANSSYQEIRDMHPKDLSTIKYDFGMFLMVFFDLPDRPMAKYHSPNIVSWHTHLTFERKHGGQWLACMKETLAMQDDVNDDLSAYMFERFTQATKDILEVTVK